MRINQNYLLYKPILLLRKVHGETHLFDFYPERSLSYIAPCATEGFGNFECEVTISAPAERSEDRGSPRRGKGLITYN